MGPIGELASSFAKSVAAGSTEVYNEFSLQHEFGIFLRERLLDYKVQFERNVGFFFSSPGSFTKRDIDIAVFSSDPRNLRYAVELKYPRNGQYPEQMFSFCKDIAFAEELQRAGFEATALVVFVDDPLFYQGSTEGIYSFFRGGEPLRGRIQKPTGLKDQEVTLVGTHSVQWQPIQGALKYAVIEVGP